MEEADAGLEEFDSFNAFFTRALAQGARTVCDQPNVVVSPCDGSISQLGNIEHGTLLQAKGTRYSLGALAGSLAHGFDGGKFVTIYLAPRDYHRVHVPAELTLTDSQAVPGELFSVNARSEASIGDLFCRNERLVCRLRGNPGDMLLIMVGALIVGSIETVWDAPVSPYRKVEQRQHDVAFERGAEFGRFLLGSTVILCFEQGRFEAHANLRSGTRLRMGEVIGQWAGPERIR
jgi:phosphatidylserine decarboxylase